ncbi:uncharacterized protein LOC116662461 [Camelus ferus]|uniref:Uncharacterized protein LOC116662461 n=1 Tax=Camelus ferus TaxID=419612 RepID=A0A8B8SPH4_CAMFR|nr:uncharacterized protein LOC116662461 [Camelus ferus]
MLGRCCHQWAGLRGGGAAGRGHPHLSVCVAQPGLRGLPLHRTWTQAAVGQDRGLSQGTNGWPEKAGQPLVRYQIEQGPGGRTKPVPSAILCVMSWDPVDAQHLKKIVLDTWKLRTPTVPSEPRWGWESAVCIAGGLVLLWASLCLNSCSTLGVPNSQERCSVSLWICCPTHQLWPDEGVPLGPVEGLRPAPQPPLWEHISLQGGASASLKTDDEDPSRKPFAQPCAGLCAARSARRDN